MAFFHFLFKIHMKEVMAHQGEMFAVMTCSLGPDLHPRISVLVIWYRIQLNCRMVTVNILLGNNSFVFLFRWMLKQNG